MIFAWDIGSSVTFQECTLLAELAKGKEVLEIGSWLGRSTIALASTARHVTAVDWHHGDFYAGERDTEEEFRANLRRYQIENVTVIPRRIEDVRDLGLYQGIFVDAAHDADSVRRHWQIAVGCARSDAWIAFHDYGRFDVTAVLDEFVPAGPEVLVETIAVYHTP